MLITLLQEFSIEELIIVIVALALAVKGCASFFDWVTGKTRDLVHKAQRPDKIQEDLIEQKIQITTMEKNVNQLTKSVTALVNSDRDAIKAYITEKHHYFVYKQKWIDDYSLECLERRYDHYKGYKGNSFVSQEMEELRDLPRQPLDATQERNKGE